jgi:zinc protease
MVTIKPTSYRHEQILFSGIKYGGSNMYDLQDRSNVNFLTSVIGAMGYGQLTPTALSDYLSDKNVNVEVSMGGIVNQIAGGGVSSELETILKLAYVKLTQPRKDTGLFKGWYNKMSAQLPLIKTDPQNLFQDSLNKVLYNGNPNAPLVIPTQVDLDAINIDRVIQIYKTQFGYADGFHFFIVGNFDTAKIKPLIEKYLGSLPTTGTPVIYRDNGVRMVKGNRLFEFRKGKDQKSLVIDVYHGDCQYSADLVLKATMLAQAMSIQIIDTIREKMQAIYSGSAVATLQKIPFSGYNFVIQMPCAPENVDKIFHELDNMITVFKKKGVAQVDLDKVKSAMIERINESAKDNGNWIAQIQQIMFWGADKNDYLRLKERVNKVTVADLKEVANLIFGSNNFRAVSFPE